MGCSKERLYALKLLHESGGANREDLICDLNMIHDSGKCFRAALVQINASRKYASVKNPSEISDESIIERGAKLISRRTILSMLVSGLIENQGGHITITEKGVSALRYYNSGGTQYKR